MFAALIKRAILPQKLVFFNATSKRQTTPRLIRNPKLTRDGVIQPKSRSYKYEID